MKRKMLTRVEVSLIACAVILSVVAGCIGQAEEEPEEAAPGVTDPDTLNVLAYGEPDQLDPATCYDARGSLVIQNLYDRLIGYDTPETTVINPRLAETWETSPDGMESLLLMQ
ncbi:MAG: hypothetical protein HXS54_13445 [Theionarchaea archaeon]|nr:hypothetical protein [Theionarchaea archaeon]